MQVSLETLVLDGGLLLRCFEIGKLRLEVLDVLLLALAEGSLSVISEASQLHGPWTECTPTTEGRCGVLK